MLDHSTPRMTKTGVNRQSIHADSGISDTLHDCTGETNVLATGDNVWMINVVAVVCGIAVVLHDEAGFTIF